VKIPNQCRKSGNDLRLDKGPTSESGNNMDQATGGTVDHAINASHQRDLG